MITLGLIFLFVGTMLAGVYHNNVPLVLTGGFLLVSLSNIMNQGSMIVFAKEESK